MNQTQYRHVGQHDETFSGYAFMRVFIYVLSCVSFVALINLTIQSVDQRGLSTDVSTVQELVSDEDAHSQLLERVKRKLEPSVVVGTTFFVNGVEQGSPDVVNFNVRVAVKLERTLEVRVKATLAGATQKRYRDDDDDDSGDDDSDGFDDGAEFHPSAHRRTRRRVDYASTSTSDTGATSSTSATSSATVPAPTDVAAREAAIKRVRALFDVSIDDVLVPAFLTEESRRNVRVWQDAQPRASTSTVLVEQSLLCDPLPVQVAIDDPTHVVCQMCKKAFLPINNVVNLFRHIDACAAASTAALRPDSGSTKMHMKSIKSFFTKSSTPSASPRPPAHAPAAPAPPLAIMQKPKGVVTCNGLYDVDAIISATKPYSPGLARDAIAVAFRTTSDYVTGKGRKMFTVVSHLPHGATVVEWWREDPVLVQFQVFSATCLRTLPARFAKQPTSCSACRQLLNRADRCADSRALARGINVLFKQPSAVPLVTSTSSSSSDATTVRGNETSQHLLKALHEKQESAKKEHARKLNKERQRAYRARQAQDELLGSFATPSTHHDTLMSKARMFNRFKMMAEANATRKPNGVRYIEEAKELLSDAWDFGGRAVAQHLATTLFSMTDLTTIIQFRRGLIRLDVGASDLNVDRAVDIIVAQVEQMRNVLSLPSSTTLPYSIGVDEGMLVARASVYASDRAPRGAEHHAGGRLSLLGLCGHIEGARCDLGVELLDGCRQLPDNEDDLDALLAGLDHHKLVTRMVPVVLMPLIHQHVPVVVGGGLMRQRGGRDSKDIFNQSGVVLHMLFTCGRWTSHTYLEVKNKVMAQLTRNEKFARVATIISWAGDGASQLYKVLQAQRVPPAAVTSSMAFEPQLLRPPPAQLSSSGDDSMGKLTQTLMRQLMGVLREGGVDVLVHAEDCLGLIQAPDHKHVVKRLRNLMRRSHPLCFGSNFQVDVSLLSLLYSFERGLGDFAYLAQAKADHHTDVARVHDEHIVASSIASGGLSQLFSAVRKLPMHVVTRDMLPGSGDAQSVPQSWRSFSPPLLYVLLSMPPVDDISSFNVIGYTMYGVMCSAFIDIFMRRGMNDRAIAFRCGFVAMVLYTWRNGDLFKGSANFLTAQTFEEMRQAVSLAIILRLCVLVRCRNSELLLQHLDMSRLCSDDLVEALFGIVRGGLRGRVTLTASEAMALGSLYNRQAMARALPSAPTTASTHQRRHVYHGESGLWEKLYAQLSVFGCEGGLAAWERERTDNKLSVDTFVATVSAAWRVGERTASELCRRIMACDDAVRGEQQHVRELLLEVLIDKSRFGVEIEAGMTDAQSRSTPADTVRPPKTSAPHTDGLLDDSELPDATVLGRSSHIPAHTELDPVEELGYDQQLEIECEAEVESGDAPKDFTSDTKSVDNPVDGLSTEAYELLERHAFLQNILASNSDKLVKNNAAGQDDDFGAGSSRMRSVGDSPFVHDASGTRTKSKATLVARFSKRHLERIVEERTSSGDRLTRVCLCATQEAPDRILCSSTVAVLAMDNTRAPERYVFMVQLGRVHDMFLVLSRKNGGTLRKRITSVSFKGAGSAIRDKIVLNFAPFKLEYRLDLDKEDVDALLQDADHDGEAQDDVAPWSIAVKRGEEAIAMKDTALLDMKVGECESVIELSMLVGPVQFERTSVALRMPPREQQRVLGDAREAVCKLLQSERAAQRQRHEQSRAAAADRTRMIAAQQLGCVTTDSGRSRKPKQLLDL